MAIAQANDGLYGDDTETLSLSWNGEWARKREQERGKSDRIEKHSLSVTMDFGGQLLSNQPTGHCCSPFCLAADR